jgi:uncharacterized membrane protein
MGRCLNQKRYKNAGGMMSHLVVLTFDDTEQAGQAFEALKQAQRRSLAIEIEYT